MRRFASGMFGVALLLANACEAPESVRENVGVARAALDSAQTTEFSLAAAGAIKLGVNVEGWIRVTQAALEGAGLSATVDPRLLQLYVGGVQQAIVVSGEDDGTFDTGDTVEFYGVGIDQTFTDTQIYWLTVGATAGLRVPTQTNATGTTAPLSFPTSVTRRDRNYYYASLLNGAASNFFGPIVKAANVSQAFLAHNVDANAAASLTLAMQGLSAGTHAIALTWNSASLGSLTYQDNFVEGTQTYPLVASTIVDGTNTLLVAAQNGSLDVNAVGYATLAYNHTYNADGDYLKCTIAGGTHVAIGNFTNANVRVFDATAGALLTPTVTASGATFSAAVDVGGSGSHTLIAFASNAALTPLSIVKDTPSTWNTPHAGELVILSNSLFTTHVAPLAARREVENWTVQLIDVQDLYDEFNGGVKDNVAIKNFLQAAQTTWTVPPRFVLFMGDASLDPRNFLGTGSWDFVPTQLIDTAFLETASDDWYGDFDNSGQSQLALGRIPVRTAQQADQVITKILSYPGASEISRGGFFVADADVDGFTFEEDTAQNIMAVAPLLPTTTWLRSQQSPDAATATAALATQLDTGPFVVNYLGHGSIGVWADILDEPTAMSLTNSDKLSVYLSMDCFNGFFQDVYTISMSEVLLEASGGAVAVWASSTEGAEAPQTTLNQSFLAQLTKTSLGEAANNAKLLITDPDVKRTYVLFGDPTLFGTPTIPTPPTTPIDAATPRFDFATNDSAAANDGGAVVTPHTEQTGCGCSFAPTPAPRFVIFTLVALGALWRRRRRSC